MTRSKIDDSRYFNVKEPPSKPSGSRKPGGPKSNGDDRSKKRILPYKPENKSKKDKGLGRMIKEEIGGKINKPINQIGEGARKGLKEGVGKLGEYGKKAGFSDQLVKAGSKELIKHGNRLIGQGVGAAKNFIHTKGRELVQQGVSKAKELGGKVKGKFEEWGNKLKRRR